MKLLVPFDGLGRRSVSDTCLSIGTPLSIHLFVCQRAPKICMFKDNFKANVAGNNFISCRDLQGPRIWLDLSFGEKVNSGVKDVNQKSFSYFLLFVFLLQVRMADGEEGTVGVRGKEHVIQNYSGIKI